MQQTSPPSQNRTLAGPRAGLRAWAARRRHALAVVGAWLLLIGVAQIAIQAAGVDHGQLLSELSELFRTPVAGPLIFVGLAALLPILLIPAASLGVVAGLIYGPAPGVIYTLIACNVSGSLAFAAGRLASRGLAQGTAGTGVLGRARAMLQRNSFAAIILLRLSLLPYDPLNYLIGVARVRWPVFIIANSIGSLPGLLVIVLFGHALGDGLGSLGHNPAFLLAALAVVALVAAGAYLARRQA